MTTPERDVVRGGGREQAPEIAYICRVCGGSVVATYSGLCEDHDRAVADAEIHTAALTGIAEAAEALIGLIDAGNYTLRYDLQRAEWEHIAGIARHSLASTDGGHSHG